MFNSVEFLLGFLPLFLLLYYLTPIPYRNITLLISSILFYAYGEPVYFFLLMGSVIVNYAVGNLLDRKNRISEKKRQAIFVMMVSADVFVLGFFKWSPNEIVLPLGISFYTFQMISYLADVYWGDICAEHSLIRLGSYFSMFPQLIAGPIVKYSEVAEDLKKRKYSLAAVDSGLKYFVTGLSLKVLLADRLSILWHEIQTVGFESISTPLAWLGAISYSLQIYFDFYGYSLMAVGLGKMLGFQLPQNFDLPYMAKSVRDFYHRWHISLGRWFKKYVYIPMGGNRKGILYTIFNLFIVWVLTSFWHGGSIHFLLWGLSLWFLITMERLLDPNNRMLQMKVLPRIYLCFFIPLTWIFFAITDLGQLGIYFGRLFGVIQGVNVNTQDVFRYLGSYGGLLLAGILFSTPLLKKMLERFKDTIPGMLILAILFWLCIWHIVKEGNNPFMYSRF
ncbi:MAG TPA: MBOAT family O-acyltransferase [Lachnospiraceae bacterium]|nr:MBOAT family O-acyltransferase [Lachnospiraceae bacterium]